MTMSEACSVQLVDVLQPQITQNLTFSPVGRKPDILLLPDISALLPPFILRKRLHSALRLESFECVVKTVC